MEHCKFSIIVVSLNPGDKLLKTIQSIAAQTCRDYEVVVKDGGSADGSLELLRSWLEESSRSVGMDEPLGERVRIYQQPDKSIYEGMNQGVALARGEWLYFLNCGDYFYSETALEDFGAKIPDEAGENLIYYGDIFDRERCSSIASNPRMNGFACYRNVPCHQACMYHNSLFRDRGYEPKYRVRADYEHFLWCFYRKQARPCYVPVILASYEGAGYSETAENRKRSAGEHREITGMYMTGPERFYYRLLLAVTLAPLRTKIAEHPALSRIYNKAKSLLYGKR